MNIEEFESHIKQKHYLYGLSEESKIVPRKDKFDITVASEIMAILCLSKDINDRLEKIRSDIE